MDKGIWNILQYLQNEYKMETYIKKKKATNQKLHPMVWLLHFCSPKWKRMKILDTYFNDTYGKMKLFVPNEIVLCQTYIELGVPTIGGKLDRSLLGKYKHHLKSYNPYVRKKRDSVTRYGRLPVEYRSQRNRDIYDIDSVDDSESLSVLSANYSSSRISFKKKMHAVPGEKSVRTKFNERSSSESKRLNTSQKTTRISSSPNKRRKLLGSSLARLRVNTREEKGVTDDEVKTMKKNDGILLTENSELVLLQQRDLGLNIITSDNELPNVTDETSKPTEIEATKSQLNGTQKLLKLKKTPSNEDVDVGSSSSSTNSRNITLDVASSPVFASNRRNDDVLKKSGLKMKPPIDVLSSIVESKSNISDFESRPPLIIGKLSVHISRQDEFSMKSINEMSNSEDKDRPENFINDNYRARDYDNKNRTRNEKESTLIEDRGNNLREKMIDENSSSFLGSKNGVILQASTDNVRADNGNIIVENTSTNSNMRQTQSLHLKINYDDDESRCENVNITESLFIDESLKNRSLVIGQVGMEEMSSVEEIDLINKTVTLPEKYLNDENSSNFSRPSIHTTSIDNVHVDDEKMTTEKTGTSSDRTLMPSLHLEIMCDDDGSREKLNIEESLFIDESLKSAVIGQFSSEDGVEEMPSVEEIDHIKIVGTLPVKYLNSGNSCNLPSSPKDIVHTATIDNVYVDDEKITTNSMNTSLNVALTPSLHLKINCDDDESQREKVNIVKSLFIDENPKNRSPAFGQFGGEVGTEEMSIEEIDPIKTVRTSSIKYLNDENFNSFPGLTKNTIFSASLNSFRAADEKITTTESTSTSLYTTITPLHLKINCDDDESRREKVNFTESFFIDQNLKIRSPVIVACSEIGTQQMPSVAEINPIKTVPTLPAKYLNKAVSSTDIPPYFPQPTASEVIRSDTNKLEHIESEDNGNVTKCSGKNRSSCNDGNRKSPVQQNDTKSELEVSNEFSLLFNSEPNLMTGKISNLADDDEATYGALGGTNLFERDEGCMKNFYSVGIDCDVKNNHHTDIYDSNSLSPTDQKIQLIEIWNQRFKQEANDFSNTSSIQQQRQASKEYTFLELSEEEDENIDSNLENGNGSEDLVSDNLVFPQNKYLYCLPNSIRSESDHSNRSDEIDTNDLKGEKNFHDLTLYDNNAKSGYANVGNGVYKNIYPYNGAGICDDSKNRGGEIRSIDSYGDRDNRKDYKEVIANNGSNNYILNDNALECDKVNYLDKNNNSGGNIDPVSNENDNIQDNDKDNSIDNFENNDKDSDNDYDNTEDQSAINYLRFSNKNFIDNEFDNSVVSNEENSDSVDLSFENENNLDKLNTSDKSDDFDNSLVYGKSFINVSSPDLVDYGVDDDHVKD